MGTVDDGCPTRSNSKGAYVSLPLILEKDMRENSTSTYLALNWAIGSRSRDPSYGPTAFSKFDGKPVISKITRSDITTVEPDELGWRKPTPYRAFGYERTPSAGYLEATSYYPRRDRTYSFGGSGSTSFGSTQGALGKNPHPMIRVVEDDVWDRYLDRSIIAARNAVADRKAAFSESLVELRKGLSDLNKGLKANADIMLGILTRNPRMVLRNFRKVNIKPTSRQRKETTRVVGNKVRLPAQHAASSLVAIEWGLKPLIEDMDLLAKLIQGKLIDGTFRINGKASVFSKFEESWTPQKGYLNPNFALNTKGDLSGREGVYTSLWFDVSVEGLRSLTELGLMDIPQTTWAVMPWSFAVDWVIPISTWLKSLSATQGLRYKGGSSTAFVRAKSTIYWDGSYTYHRPVAGAADPKGVWYMSNDVLSTFSMDRRVHERPPVGLPSFKDPFGAYETVMSASLLASRIKALPRS